MTETFKEQIAKKLAFECTGIQGDATEFWKRETDSLISTIMAKVNSAGLTDEKMYHMVQDYGWGKDTEERGFILSIMDITSQTQLQTIKDILK